MKRILILLVTALTACSAKAPMYLEVVRSEMARNPEASYIDGLGGKLKWNYTTGLELKAFLDVYYDMAAAGAEVASKGIGPYELPFEVTSAQAEAILNYVDAWYDAIIAEDGTIGVNYKKSNYSTDHICPGRTLFQLYDLTGNEKYRKAMDVLYTQIKEQPRTPEGGFWHKQIYPDQMWLDGLYMAQPFYAEYTARYVPNDEQQANYEDIVLQFKLAYDHCYDSATGLLRHAWDSSHKMFWCDPATGQSSHAWGRACGWYAMALVEVIPFIPAGELKDQLKGMLNTLCSNILEYTSPCRGMWYQVLDRPGEKGNYLEATASAMFTYVLLKGTREGWIDCIDRNGAQKEYRSLLRTFVRKSKGLVNLNKCCEVAGLGGKENRSGTYEYYINEKIRSNDPKGIGPLIWASLEYGK